MLLFCKITSLNQFLLVIVRNEKNMISRNLSKKITKCKPKIIGFSNLGNKKKLTGLQELLNLHPKIFKFIHLFYSQ